MLGTKCIDKNYNSTKWYWRRGKQPCESIGDFDSPIVEEQMITANHIIFSFQIPIPKDGFVLDYSRWQQSLTAALYLDMPYSEGDGPAPDAVMTLDARLGYSDRGDPAGKWTEYASSKEYRHLACSIAQKRPGSMYSCSPVPLFRLGSLHHDFYLLNIRLPVDMFDTSEETGMNTKLGQINDMWVSFIHQNGGFTKVWLSLKTIFFPVVLVTVLWFWRRVAQLPRPPTLLENILVLLGASLSQLNCPLEYLTLALDCPWMPLLNDLRHGFFYATLLPFWLIFIGEHIMTDNKAISRGLYVLGVLLVLSGCLVPFAFDCVHYGRQLSNPFYAQRASGTLAMGMAVLKCILGGVYFCFLSYLIWKAFTDIGRRYQSLANKDQPNELSRPTFKRYRAMMAATHICAALTIIFIVLLRVSEAQATGYENIKLEYTSGFFTGVYGTWNIYTFSLLCLYAPSRIHA
ncbi:putative protein wntless [Penaeus vannamei]|uniref:Protein wntless n=1 Tax=Penaeus vannamei TaxID=6689 RepID=A0A423TG67_PENVA|nr:putative protein wntless [Penaeus vannamei]